MTSILFVCLGNICRSPAAEGMMRHLVEKEPLNFDIVIQSCGLGSWHVGKLPDKRMREAALKRGIPLVSRAQSVKQNFFDEFDLILAADHKVLNELKKYIVNPDHQSKLQLITQYSGFYPNEEIPDPYHDEGALFEHVLDMLDDSCKGLLHYLKTKHKQIS